MKGSLPSTRNPETATARRLLRRILTGWDTALLLAALLFFNRHLVTGALETAAVFRPGAAGGGQWWLIFTHPFVHVSAYHLLLDAGAFWLLYTGQAERRRGLRLLVAAACAAAGLAATLLIFPAGSHPGLCGLSGAAHGLAALVAVEMARGRETAAAGFICLLLVAGKAAWEGASGSVLFGALHMGMCGHPVAAAHAGGVLGGLLVALLRGVNPPVGALRMAVRILVHGLYRVRKRQLGHIPAHGAAVLVSNHVSYMDGMLIAAVCRRPVRFVVHAPIYRLPVLHGFFKLAGAVPIEGNRVAPRTCRRAFDTISSALGQGELVCIFPEGCLTRSGQLNRFRPGIERIVRRNPVPVVPLALRGMWGSMFSHGGGPALRKPPRRLRARLEVVAGCPVPPEAVTAGGLRRRVLALL